MGSVLFWALMSVNVPISTLPPKPPLRFGQMKLTVPAVISSSHRPKAAPIDVRSSCRRDRPWTCSWRSALSAWLVSACGLSAGSTW